MSVEPRGKMRTYFREPKRALAGPETTAWWYADTGGIEVFIDKDGKTVHATITQRQLRTLIKQIAIGIMENP